MNKILPYVLLVILAVGALVFKQCNAKEKQSHTSPKTSVVAQQRGLNRNPTQILYSKHARCRMSCRQVSESEVIEILKNGTINYKKSQLQTSECKKKYAVEGFSKDGQHLRIIFAPCNQKVTVVTCIDLETDWSCDCK